MEQPMSNSMLQLIVHGIVMQCRYLLRRTPPNMLRRSCVVRDMLDGLASAAYACPRHCLASPCKSAEETNAPAATPGQICAHTRHKGT